MDCALSAPTSYRLPVAGDVLEGQVHSAQAEATEPIFGIGCQLHRLGVQPTFI